MYVRIFVRRYYEDTYGYVGDTYGYCIYLAVVLEGWYLLDHRLAHLALVQLRCNARAEVLHALRLEIREFLHELRLEIRLAIVGGGGYE